MGHGDKDEGYMIADFVIKRGMFLGVLLLLVLAASVSSTMYAAQARETEHVRTSMVEMLAALQQHFERERQTHALLGQAKQHIAAAVANHSSVLQEIVHQLNDDPLNIYQVWNRILVHMMVTDNQL
jgi:hypothetical protein